MVLAAIIPGYAVPSRLERERFYVENQFRESSARVSLEGGIALQRFPDETLP